MSPDEWQALLAASLDEVEPPEDGEEDLDPESCALPPDEDLAAIEDETDRIAAEHFADAQYLTQAETAELAGASAASEARKRGPRGPGLPGSADWVPGVSGGPAAGFGTGQCLDLAPGSANLHSFIETVVHSGRLGEASADEIIGLITAADRAEAAICYLKHAAATELIRRRPAPGCTLTGPSRMPDHYLDSAGDEVKWALAETRQTADGVLSLAHADHRSRHHAAGRRGGPSGGGAGAGPGQAPKPGRAAARDRAGRRPGRSGEGEEAAGARRLEGDMDQLRARAYLDILVDQDSRPPASRGTAPDSTGADHPVGPHRPPGSGGNTDSQGRADGHACARPEPRSQTRRRKRRPPGGTDPPGAARTGFTFSPGGPGPPGGYGRHHTDATKAKISDGNRRAWARRKDSRTVL